MASPNPSRAAALDVLIVGGGPCGLAAAISVALAGHKATVCEASERENQLGSGVQIAPNATRLLSRWGLHDVLGQVASVPRLLEIRHLNGDPVVRREAYEREIIDQFGFPFWTTHRVDLQAGLIRRATELGVQIQYSSRVTKVDSTGPFIELRNGERYHGDLILIADGATSTLRPQVLRTPTMGRPTSDMAYRLTIDRAKVHDQELLDFMDLPQIRIWTGPGSLAVGYPLKEGTQLTVLIITAVTGCQDRTSMSAVIGELKGLLKDWDPMLPAMLDAVQRVNSWRLMHSAVAPTWRSPASTCILAGDCCHPMPPSLAQGLNLALEDAATLGALLGHVTSSQQLPSATALYERLRRRRTDRLLEGAAAYEQEWRLKTTGVVPPYLDEESGQNLRDRNMCMYPMARDWIWSYDAYEEAERAYLSEPY